MCSCQGVVTGGIDWIDRHTVGSDIILDSGIVYCPTEKVAPTLQTQDFEDVKLQDLESQTEGKLMYCHSTQWPEKNPHYPSASSDERVFTKLIVWVIRKWLSLPSRFTLL